MFERVMDGGVARIRLDRPAARNAVPTPAWRVLAELASGSRARAVLIESAVDGVFCAGADLVDLARLADDPAARAPFREAMRAAFDALAARPTIACVEGGCFGAGVALAMACAVRVAGPAARFAIPPAKLGISYPQEDVARLVTLVGSGQAARLLLGGGTIDAQEAARIGLVDILAENARAAALSLAREIAANSAASVAELLRAIRGESGDDGFDAAFGGADFAEGLAAFREKRRPRFA